MGKDINEDSLTRISAALATWLKGQHPSAPGIAIGYDRRENAADYARLMAEEISNLGIVVYLSDSRLTHPGAFFYRSRPSPGRGHYDHRQPQPLALQRG